MVERIVKRAAGLDVHKNVIVAEAHLPGGVVEQGPGKPPTTCSKTRCRSGCSTPGTCATSRAVRRTYPTRRGAGDHPFRPSGPAPGHHPRIDQRTAQGLLAEIGTDMGVFGTASRLASWAGVCPGNHESAGRSKSGATRKGPRWLGISLHDAAMGAPHTKNTYLAAQYTRLRPRLGHPQALVAVEHSILVSIFCMLQRNQPYHDLGVDYFIRREDPARRARKLIRQLEAIGYTIHAQSPPARG